MQRVETKGSKVDKGACFVGQRGTNRAYPPLHRVHTRFGMLAYCTILLTSILGYLGAPWWSLLFGAGTLTIIALRGQRQYRVRFATIGESSVLEAASHASIAHALLAAI